MMHHFFSQSGHVSECPWCHPGAFSFPSMLVHSSLEVGPLPKINPHTIVFATMLSQAAGDKGENPELEQVARRTALVHELQHFADVFSTSHGFLLVTRVHRTIESLLHNLLAAWVLVVGRPGVHVLDFPLSVSLEPLELRYPQHPTGPFCCERVAISPVPDPNPSPFPEGVAGRQRVVIDGVPLTIPVVSWRMVVGVENHRMVFHRYHEAVDCTAILECLGLHMQRMHVFQLGAQGGTEATGHAWDSALTNTMTGAYRTIQWDSSKDSQAVTRWTVGRTYETFSTFLRQHGINISLRGVFAAAEFALMHELEGNVDSNGAFHVIHPRNDDESRRKNVGGRLLSLVDRVASYPPEERDEQIIRVSGKEVRSRTAELADAVRVYWQRTAASQEYQVGLSPRSTDDGQPRQGKLTFRILEYWIQEFVMWLPFRETGALSARPDLFNNHIRPWLSTHRTPNGPTKLLSYGPPEQAYDALSWVCTVSALNDFLHEPKVAHCPLKHRGGNGCDSKKGEPILDTCKELLTGGGFEDCGELPTEKPHPHCLFYKVHHEMTTMGLKTQPVKLRLSAGDSLAAREGVPAAVSSSLEDVCGLVTLQTGNWQSLTIIEALLNEHPLKNLSSSPLTMLSVRDVGTDTWPWNSLASSGALQSIVFGCSWLQSVPSSHSGRLRVALSLIVARALERLSKRPISIDLVGGLFARGKQIGFVRVVEAVSTCWAHIVYAERWVGATAPWITALDELWHPKDWESTPLVAPSLRLVSIGLQEERHETCIPFIRALAAEALTSNFDTPKLRRLDSESMKSEIVERTRMFAGQPVRIESSEFGTVVGVAKVMDANLIAVIPGWKVDTAEPSNINPTAILVPTNTIIHAHFLAEKPAFVLEFEGMTEDIQDP